MLLKQLEYFISVVEHNSFTQAAYEHYVSQSAISQQIKSLESSLGIPLMVREKRSFYLTPAVNIYIVMVSTCYCVFRIYKRRPARM